MILTKSVANSHYTRNSISITPQEFQKAKENPNDDVYIMMGNREDSNADVKEHTCKGSDIVNKAEDKGDFFTFKF